MKTIKITNGEVQIKDFCPRKLKKEINKVFSELQMKTEDGQSKIEGMKLETMDKANDVALVGMTDKITINNEEQPVCIDTFDSMDSKDIDNVLEEINKVTGKEIPKN